MKIGSGPKKALFITLFLLFLGVQVTATGGDPFFPIAALKPEMKGEGYTVFSATKVESFPVEIVGIMEGSGSLSHLILVKLTGGQVVAAGMSGSPVFIGGKLVGAIGYGFENADPRYAIVTPIEEMLALWDRAPDETFHFTEGGLPGYDGVALGEGPAEGPWLRARPVATPLFLSSYRPLADNYLLATLQERGAYLVYPERPTAGQGLIAALQPLAFAGKYSRHFDSASLQPGSALTLTLAEGDYQATALGTLTWREQDKFFGFGHSFLNKGRVEYGVGSAEILDVIDSPYFPFKVGIASSSLGRVLQDRRAGVAGEFGVLPRMIPVTTEVTDEITGISREYAFTVVNDEDLFPGLVLAGVLDTIDRTIDRIGPGTANIYFELNGANFPSFQRENLFYGDDVAAAALLEFAEMIRVITENEFIKPEFTGIKLSIKVNGERRSAQINKVDLPKQEFAPGEKITLSVDLLPYRGQVAPTPVEVTLPTTPGKWMLMVYGSQYGFTAEEQGSNGEELYSSQLYPEYSNLEEMLADYQQRPQNNQLVVELLPAEGMLETEETMEQPEDPEAETTQRREEGAEEPETIADRNYHTVSTSYFVTGAAQISFEILALSVEEAMVAPSHELDGNSGQIGF